MRKLDREKLGSFAGDTPEEIKDFADNVGVSASLIKKMLAGTRDNPGLNTITNLCRVTGLSFDELFPEIDVNEAA